MLETQVLETQVLETQLLETQLLETQVLETQLLETQVLETQVLEHPLSAVVAYQGPVKRENIKKYGTRQGGNLTEKLMK